MGCGGSAALGAGRHRPMVTSPGSTTFRPEKYLANVCLVREAHCVSVTRLLYCSWPASMTSASTSLAVSAIAINRCRYAYTWRDLP
jgi:hypothetical protein